MQRGIVALRNERLALGGRHRGLIRNLKTDRVCRRLVCIQYVHQTIVFSIAADTRFVLCPPLLSAGWAILSEPT